ncbi:dynamin [Gossypium australe]|uniref:Dynamin n=1 Tax=Gossypium australe TaxID=47621 RepID=A0A5B6VJB4_9ROSI|nr:dynamin [Gossypium australe]
MTKILSSGKVLQPDNAEVVLTIMTCEPKEKDTKDSPKRRRPRKNECCFFFMVLQVKRDNGSNKRVDSRERTQTESV